MGEKIDIIQRQSPDIWQWAKTTITSLICSEADIDEMIDLWTKKIEDSGMELLDLHVFKWYEGGFDMVNTQFLIRPKQHK